MYLEEGELASNCHKSLKFFSSAVQDGHDRWIYSGIDGGQLIFEWPLSELQRFGTFWGTWLVGGPKQKEQSFASRALATVAI